MIEIRFVNRITGQDIRMAMYEAETMVAHIQLDHQENRMRADDTYNLTDELMDKLAMLGCEVVYFTELNRPEFPDTTYIIPFADWYGQPLVDYGFGSGLQHPMPAARVRRTPRAL